MCRTGAVGPTVGPRSGRTTCPTCSRGPGIGGVLDTIRGLDSHVDNAVGAQAGQVWETEEIDAEIARITSISAEAAARGVTKTLDADVVESVNVHESIKLGKTVLGLSRDEAIDNYVTTIRRLGRAGVKVVCYNFMPIFDWLRTDLRHSLPDG